MHKENIIASYTFEENWLDLSVTETLDADFANRNTEILRYFFCKVLGISARKDFGTRAGSMHTIE